jgi:broad specificity phosphatase PhoE
MQLFIVRHAEPDYSTDSLTPAGQLEAQALAKRMVSNIKPDVIYSSPMGRAQATMRPTAEAMGLATATADQAAVNGKQ